MEHLINLDKAITNPISAFSLLNHKGNLVQYDEDIYYVDNVYMDRGYMFLELTDMSHNEFKLVLQIFIYEGNVNTIYILG
jgi:hypothetical protein